MITKSGYKPIRAVFEALQVFGFQRREERRSILSGAIPYAIFIEITDNQLARHHKQKCLLHQLPTNEQFGRLQWGGRMKTGWSIDFARMHQ
jgi:hypothetical protein